MEADCNKVFLPVAGRPLLAHTIESMAKVGRIDEIVAVVHPSEADLVAELSRALGRPVRIVPGGDQRRDSSLAGVTAADGDLLLIHDGARPFPSRSLINRVLDGALEHRACIPVLPVVDTLRPIQSGRLGGRSIPRDGLVRVQTPQGFEATLIRQALAKSDAAITDDAAAILAIGEEVWTVSGESTNLKITTRDDLLLAEAIASMRSHETARP